MWGGTLDAGFSLARSSVVLPELLGQGWAMSVLDSGRGLEAMKGTLFQEIELLVRSRRVRGVDRKRLRSPTASVQIPPGHLPAVAQPGESPGPFDAGFGEKGGGGR